MTDNYRSYKTSADGSLQIEGNPGPKKWALLDKDNGNPECGHGYLWIFDKRDDAREHRRKQNSDPDPTRAVLRGPWRVESLTSDFLKKERFKSSPQERAQDEAFLSSLENSPPPPAGLPAPGRKGGWYEVQQSTWELWLWRGNPNRLKLVQTHTGREEDLPEYHQVRQRIQLDL